MFLYDKKHAYTTIMARRGDKGGERVASPAPMKAEEVMSEPGEVDGRHVASQDILSAIHEKSADKLMQALANFHDLHSSMAKGEEEETPSE